MKKSVVFLLHIGYWLTYLLLLSVIFAIANIQLRKPPQFSNLIALFPVLAFCLVPNLFSFYSFYILLFPKFLRRKKILALIVFGTIVSIISALLCSLISLFILGFDQPIFTEINEFITLNVSLFLIAGIHGTIALVIRGFITWYDEIKLKEELANKNYEMELALIKSQINPHFLFNTINNIDFLITKDSAKASEYLNKLSDILRYMVYETKTGKIPVSEELNYIEKYLELQRIRTSNADYVSFEVIGNANNLMIAPMILFPFIENAFKHTESNKKLYSIDLKIEIKENTLNFECKNTYQDNSNEKQDYGGLGNELISKRLMLIYPEKHTLKTNNDNGVYQVELTLDLI